MRMPIAHGEGNYFDTEAALDALEANRQVVFRYVSPAGELDPAWNVNGRRAPSPASATARATWSA